VIDRCLQARLKNALEPEWEARFEGSSYGFRPGRRQHDAVARIYLLARPHQRKKWVVDADIAGAFDAISQDHILAAIGSFPGRQLIKQWLKAGYVEDGIWHETLTGTGQGSVISPLLANVALHGMEEALGVHHDKRGQIDGPRAVVRYADDWVVFCESKEDAAAVIATMRAWLAERGLRFSDQKTRIVHLTDGFEFLGFSIRQYPARGPSPTGYKLLIRPSKASVRKLRERLRALWRERRGQPVARLIHDLNPLIRGWANYFRIGVAAETFAHLDTWMYTRAYRYARHRHPKKSWAWRQQRYWGQLHPQRGDHWVFGDPQTGTYLLKFGWFAVRRHVLVRGTASPDDPYLRAYWQRRAAAKAAEHSVKTQQVAQRQGHVCPVCNETLFNDEELHLHHSQARQQGGADTEDNLLLLHLYCHQQLHSTPAQGHHAPQPQRRWLRTWLA